MADVIEWEAKSIKKCQGPQRRRAESGFSKGPSPKHMKARLKQATHRLVTSQPQETECQEVIKATAGLLHEQRLERPTASLLEGDKV